MGMGALTKLLALRKILEGTDKPTSAIRDVGQAFSSRAPSSYFENFKVPAEDTQSALQQYGVHFVPRSPGKMSAVRGSDVYGIKQFNPDYFDQMAGTYSPSLGRIVRDPAYRDKLYEIEASSSNAGSGVGSRMYPAIFDVLSGGQELVNSPTHLTAINEMRRNANTAEALIRNPRLAHTVLPIDQQLSPIRVTPEDYLGFDYSEKVGALILANAAQALRRGDRIASSIDDFPPSMDARDALRRFESLSPTSSRGAFQDAARSPFRERGIGESTTRRMNIVDSILANKRFNPDLWIGLGKRKGGLV